MERYNHKTDFLVAALLGGILGGAAGLLCAPKSGQELRKGMLDQYNSIQDKKDNLAQIIKEKGECLLDYFNGNHEEKEESCDTSALLIGGVVGLVLGATAALLLAPKSGNELRELLGDKYETIRDKSEELAEHLQNKGKEGLDRLDDWKETLGTVVEKLKRKGLKKGRSKVQEIANWAELGLNLIHQLQKR